MKLPVELQKEEKVMEIVQRHIVYLVQNLAGVFLGGVVPFIVLLIIAGQVSGVLQTIVILAAIIWGIGSLIVLYFTWYRYQNDIWIITNQRLIDSTKRHPFHHQVSSADLVNVEDMTIVKSGVLPTMFNYGNLSCQTAGAQGTFVLYGIPNPSGILEVVDSGRDAARRELGYRPGQMGMG